jgi:hypothetical protein
MKTAELINKVAGSGMLTLSAAFLALSGLGVLHSVTIPGLFFGIVGTVLLTRRDKTPALPSDVADRLARLEAAVASTQQDLELAQGELHQINEERHFLRQLRATGAAPVHEASEREVL